jgi:hypothetical protein
MKRYKVVGTAPILDHQPGETFEQTIPADLEKYLIGIGGLAIVGGKAKSDNKSKATVTHYNADRI